MHVCVVHNTVLLCLHVAPRLFPLVVCCASAGVRLLCDHCRRWSKAPPPPHGN